MNDRVFRVVVALSVFALMGMAGAGVVAAQDATVGEDAGDDYSSLQTAINTEAAGSTIQVQDNYDPTSDTFPITVSKQIAINGTANAVVSAPADTNVIEHTSSTLNVSDLTIEANSTSGVTRGIRSTGGTLNVDNAVLNATGVDDDNYVQLLDYRGNNGGSVTNSVFNVEYSDAIHVRTTSLVTVDGNTFNGIDSEQAVGVNTNSPDGEDNVVVTNNNFDTIGSPVLDFGVFSDTADNLEVSGNTVTNSDGLLASDGTKFSSIAANVGSNFQITEVNPTGANSSVIEGNNETYEVTVNNTGDDQDAQDVNVTVAPGTPDQVSNSSQLELGPGENGTVTLEVDTSGLAVDLYDVNVSTDDNNVDPEGTLSVADANERNLITGELTDNSGFELDNPGDVRITIQDTTTGEILVDNVPVSEFGPGLTDRPDVSNTVGESEFIPYSDPRSIQYRINLPNSGTGTQFDITAELTGFKPFDGDTEPLGPGDTDNQDIRPERRVTPDFLEIDKTPGPSVDLTGTITDNVTVITQDEPPVGDNSTLSGTPVDVTIVDSNTGSIPGVSDADLDITPTPAANTGANGAVEFDISLSGIEPDEVEQNVEFTLEFEATEGIGVTQQQQITFEADPPAGDGTISGTVDEIDQSIPVGITAQSNIEPGTNVSVHAVTGERAAENTVGGFGSPFITFGGGGEKAPTPPIVELDFTGTSALNFEANQNETVRVVAADVNTATDTIVDPTSVSPLDSRSDYLYTSNELSLTQNTSTVGAGAGFDANENEGFSANDLSITVLDSSEDLQAPRDGYAVQFYNETTDSWETQVAFETENDLSYQATKDRFSDVRTQATDVTNSQGDFELLNLFTNDESEKTYVVIAGDANSSLGFANARGYSIQPVNQNAAGDTQLEADLSVQEFTPDVVLNYDLDVSVRDDNGDLVEIEEVPVDEDREVVVNVTATDQLTGNQFPVPSSQEIDLSLLDDAATQSRIDGNDPTSGSPNFGELLDETVVVNQQHPDGTEYASTTFEADPVNTGVANISASTQNDDGTVFETRDGSGAGTNDRGDQAQIEVFDTVEITGDVVNEDQQNIEGARVLLFDDDVSDPTSVQSGDSEVIREAVTGSDGSYAFVDVRTGEDYEIRAIALDANGNQVSNTRRIQNGDPVFNTPPGQDIVVQGASPNQPFIPADFEVSNLVPPTATVEQGELLNISADVENTGGLEGTQDIELLIDGNTVATKQDVELDESTSTNVEFEDVDTSSLQPGSYVHEVASEDDNVTGSLTVESSDGGNGGAPSNNPLFDESGEPMGELDVISVLTDWSDTGEINGEEVGELELIGYLTDWNEAQSGN